MRLLLLVGLFISPLVSALTLDDLQKQFSEQPVVRAHFDQTRTIKDLPQPLRSQGRMLIAPFALRCMNSSVIIPAI